MFERRTSDKSRSRGGDTSTDVGRDGLSEAIRSAAQARVEILAGVVDTAQAFLRTAIDHEPFSVSQDYGEVIRMCPETLKDAAAAAADVAAQIPRRLAETFGDEFDLGDGRRARRAGKTGRAGTARGVSSAERRIIKGAEDYLGEVPASGAMLDVVVENVALETGYDQDIIKSVLQRHFVNNGVVILNKREVSVTAPVDPVLDWMKDELRRLGYDDLKTDFELTTFPDLEETAALVAFDGGEPAVVCLPVDPGEVDDAAYREAARFQSAAVAPGKTARFAWVSDGVLSYVYDMKENRTIAKLPPRHQPSAKTPPKSQPSQQPNAG
jgi:hypothetical protein